ncbi:hypothetical protein ACIKP9_07850 [Methylobacillus methanolivorans]|uniref:Uncharacterized protein n=1 Tax=Methylobacillus methanolivorans TaxID=1848927 RepID=A0ABW8GL47_9PROT
MNSCIFLDYAEQELLRKPSWQGVTTQTAHQVRQADVTLLAMLA